MISDTKSLASRDDAREARTTQRPRIPRGRKEEDEALRVQAGARAGPEARCAGACSPRCGRGACRCEETSPPPPSATRPRAGPALHTAWEERSGGQPQSGRARLTDARRARAAGCSRRRVCSSAVAGRAAASTCPEPAGVVRGEPPDGTQTGAAKPGQPRRSCGRRRGSGRWAGLRHLREPLGAPPGRSERPRAGRQVRCPRSTRSRPAGGIEDADLQNSEF